jgi:hypothetical protein
MEMYRSTWYCFAALAGIAGMWAGVQSMSPAGSLGIFLFVAVGTASVVLTTSEMEERTPWRRVFVLAAAMGAVVVAAAGLLVWLEMLGLAIVAVLALSSPMVLDRTARLWRQTGRDAAVDRTDARGAGADPDPLPPHPERDAVGAPEEPPSAGAAFLLSAWLEGAPRLMDDAALCLAWRRSYLAVQKPLPGALMLRIVERRQEMLVELERRNEAGFSAWLASGPRAASDPTRFITPGRDRR